MQLQANFSFEALNDLISVFRASLEGPNGEKFLVENYDYLSSLCFNVWTEYVSPVLIQIEHFYYLKMTKELEKEYADKFQPIIEVSLKPCFIEGIKVFLKVASTNDETIDILWISKMTLELSKLLEEKNEFKTCTQILKNTYEKIITYRDESILLRTESKNELLLPFCLTTDNKKIDDMVGDIKKQYLKWKVELERKIRRFKRQKMRKRAYKPEEEDEEEDEVFRYAKQFYNDELKDDYIFNNIKTTRISEFDLIINCI